LPVHPVLMLLVFAVTLFTSASLLFLVEPMVGKMMLPLLGGTPAVWNTCMVFFQVVLLAGYGYAHATTKWLGVRKQALFHLGVVLVPFLFFLVNGPLAINEALIVGWEGNPIPGLLMVLTLSVGVPMFVVCTSAPIFQRWFSATDHPAAADPYFLYGASNLGSMLALVGYPLVIEPYFKLAGQRFDWAIGYTILVALTALCAYLMWQSPEPKLALETADSEPAPVPNEPTPAPVHAGQVTSERSKGRQKRKERDRATAYRAAAAADTSAATRTAPIAQAPAREQPVTWLRRMHWVALAAIPSSLMLGVTTYITTDIAAIPLLWVLPLALYLLTFIFVFARISPQTQKWIIFIGALLGLVAVGIWVVPLFLSDNYEALRWMVRGMLLLPAWFAMGILNARPRDRLLHEVIVMVAPLLVLLLIFMMLAEVKSNSIWVNIALHSITLFMVAMLCHGELAMDRPDPAHLTEFFLWMSFGGVVGGLFNAIVAPLIFNSLVEYQLMLAVFCLFVPALGTEKDTGSWSRWADLGLTIIFATVGLTLMGLFLRDYFNAAPENRAKFGSAPWLWSVSSVLIVALLWGIGQYFFPARRWWTPEPLAAREKLRDTWADRLFDILLPLSLFILVVGLFWGLASRPLHSRLVGISEWIYPDRDEQQIQLRNQIRYLLRFGLPAVLCYTFVERQLRFGLGVGALLLAAGFSAVVADPPIFQTRSFFGVLKVEKRNEDSPYETRSLMHGTTLHGMQFTDPTLHHIPLTYYHTSGPIGQVFRTYNTVDRPMAVIGLGTGTMSCYALPGQKATFYDIDFSVKRISYPDPNNKEEPFFTFVADAKERGADIDLVMGDARLTLARQKLEGDQRYGLMVVDAFSSDAIPVHLITNECLKMFLEKMRDDGIVCFHISNRYLDLHPVLANLAVEQGLAGLHMSDSREDDWVGKSGSHWVCLARKPEHLAKLLSRPRWETDSASVALAEGLAMPDPVGVRTALSAALWRAMEGGSLETTASEKGWQAIDFESEVFRGGAVPLRHHHRDWVPIETPDDLEARIKVIDERLEKLKTETAELAKKIPQDSELKEGSPEKKLATQLEELRMERRRLAGGKKRFQSNQERLRAVGVWSDDYSNLLSVFKGRGDDD
jgi:hypothetical protein